MDPWIEVCEMDWANWMTRVSGGERAGGPIEKLSTADGIWGRRVGMSVDGMAACAN